MLSPTYNQPMQNNSPEQASLSCSFFFAFAGSRMWPRPHEAQQEGLEIKAWLRAVSLLAYSVAYLLYNFAPSVFLPWKSLAMPRGKFSGTDSRIAEQPAAYLT